MTYEEVRSSVVVAWAQYGENNAVVMAVINTPKGLDLICFQPQEQTHEMQVLFSTCAACVRQMTEAVIAERFKRGKMSK